MVFKKFDEQQVYQVPCISADGDTLKVGAVFSHDPKTKEVAEVTKKEQALGALKDQKELYLVAQGDPVTEKTGTEHKDYNIGRIVNLVAATEKIVAAYRITMIDNVEGWED